MDQQAWEAHYRSTGHVPEVASILQQHAGVLTGGDACDIAMGAGHNAVFLAERGYTVTGVDYSAAAVALAREHAARQGVTLNAVVADVCHYAIPPGTFDVILNCYFLERSLVPAIRDGLTTGGLVFFETYTTEQQHFGGPHNPAHLLRPNELLELFQDFFIVFYHEQAEENQAVARLVAKKLGGPVRR